MADKRVFSVSFTATITAAGGDADYLEAKPNSLGQPVRLLGWSLGQITDVRDKTEKGIRFSILRLGSISSGSGGSSVTPRASDSADVAAAAICAVNNATVATGTAITLAEHGWVNRHSPWDFFYPEDGFYPEASGTDGLVFRQQTTLSGDITVAGTFWLEAGIGG